MPVDTRELMDDVNYAIDESKDTPSVRKNEFFPVGTRVAEALPYEALRGAMSRSSFRQRGNLELILARARNSWIRASFIHSRRRGRSCVTLCSRLLTQACFSLFLSRATAARIASEWSRTGSLAAVDSRLRTASCARRGLSR